MNNTMICIIQHESVMTQHSMVYKVRDGVNHAVYPPSAPPLPPPTAWSPPGFPAPSNTTTTTHAG